MSLLSRTGRALVLGCGPAGIFAAKAALDVGWDVEIISRKRVSEMFGAQYLHQPIPGLSTDDPIQVQYWHIGTPEEYRLKVYGPESNWPVSVETLPYEHRAWDIRAAYYEGYRLLSSRIADHQNITSTWMDNSSNFGGIFSSFDRVISSLPAPAICAKPGQHIFLGRDIWAIGDAPERGQKCPIRVAEPSRVVCDGTAERSWYRNSNVFGYVTAEWATETAPPYEGASRVTKPLSSNCDCFPEVWRVGRYGIWKKGILSHQAYQYVHWGLQSSLARLVGRRRNNR